MKHDPECLTNLIGQHSYAPAAAQLKAQLLSELKEQEDSRVLGRDHIFDQYPAAGLAVRGFYERPRKGEVMKTGWINPSDFEKPLFEPAPLP